MKRALVVGVVVLLAGVSARLGLTSRSSSAESENTAPSNLPHTRRALGSGGGRPLYVAPNGRRDADGTITHPVDLATALAADGPVNPGDTVWLRAGTYYGNFKSALRGAESAPITVRAYPGEHAVISAAVVTEPALTVGGMWTWYAGFEITNEKPERLSAEVQNVALRRGVGVMSSAPHVKFIDLIVHDLEGGFDIPAEAEDVELYGNLIYYNGWQRADGVGEGNGITSPNQTEGRFIRDNIIFNQFSHGIQAFGGARDNLYIEGNVLFDNGGIAKYPDRHILVGAGSKNLVLDHNMTYYKGGPPSMGEGVNVGFGGDCPKARISDNYLTGSKPLNLGDCRPAVMRGNTLYGRLEPSDERRYRDNVFVAPKDPNTPAMTGVKVFVRTNLYEPGRSHVAVFNWDRLPTISADVSQTGLNVSDEFEVRNALDYFAPPVLSGTYKGGPLTIPMRGLTVAKPLGAVTNQPASTAPEFGAFVVIAKGAANAPAVATASTR
jgi:hypothetical protein